jgi:hypothetical protein
LGQHFHKVWIIQQEKVFSEVIKMFRLEESETYKVIIEKAGG